MPDLQPQTIRKPTREISLDTWAVVLALLAATLIRLGLIAKIPW